MRKVKTVALAIIVRNELRPSKVIFNKIPFSSVDEVVCIDGNSNDGTYEFFVKKNVRTFLQKQKGLGAATREARGNISSEAIIFFHPDGNERPSDITTVANLLRKGHAFVIPSRMVKGGVNEEDHQFFKPRKWFNKCLAYIVNMLWNRSGTYVTETVQGFRGIRVDVFDSLELDVTDRTIDLLMVIRAMKKNIPLYEFPTLEGWRIAGKTKFGSLSTGMLIIKTLLRELLKK